MKNEDKQSLEKKKIKINKSFHSFYGNQNWGKCKESSQ